MSSQRDKILQHLARYPYIEYAALFSKEAELLNQPVGNWTEGDAIVLAGQMLYVAQKISSELNQGEIKQIWLTTERGHLIGVNCPPSGFLLVKANNQVFLGELRKVVERTANDLSKVLKAEENSQLISTENSLETEQSGVEKEKSTFPEVNNLNPSGKLRGRNFIE